MTLKENSLVLFELHLSPDVFKMLIVRKIILYCIKKITNSFTYVCARACANANLCLCVRESVCERERERVCVCVCLFVSLCECV